MNKIPQNRFTSAEKAVGAVAKPGRREQSKLPYVETATRFGIASAPYSKEARERDLAWALSLREKPGLGETGYRSS